MSEPTLTQLHERLAALKAARATGIREVEYQGRRTVYRSDSELHQACLDLERQIQKAVGGRFGKILFATSKGLN